MVPSLLEAVEVGVVEVDVADIVLSDTIFCYRIFNLDEEVVFCNPDCADLAFDYLAYCKSIYIKIPSSVN